MKNYRKYLLFKNLLCLCQIQTPARLVFLSFFYLEHMGRCCKIDMFSGLSKSMQSFLSTDLGPAIRYMFLYLDCSNLIKWLFLKFFWNSLNGEKPCHKFTRKRILFYKIIQIVRALWLAIKPFYISVCKHGFRSSFISYFIKEM